ncbi:MAG: fibronectin type III domain-containing protein, partial [Micrococcales bacterium]|nr:fibronectin type III domain-containing protein [Micrococcales bacterium]
VTYLVNDAFNEPDRVVEASFQAVVRGVPETPCPPRLGAPGDGQVTLAWDPPQDNGAPIDDYLVTWNGGSQVCGQASCVIGGLTNGRSYSFTVQARNAVGASAPSPPSATILVDLAPNKPGDLRATPGQQSVTLSWQAPPASGSAVTHYTVQVLGPGPPRSHTVFGTSLQINSLVGGQSYSFTVQAHNAHFDPSPVVQVSAVPFDHPGRPAVTAVRQDARTYLASGSQVDGRGSAPVYSVMVSDQGGAAVAYCAGSAVPANCPVVTQPGHTYQFWVEAKNQTGQAQASDKLALWQYTQPVVEKVQALPVEAPHPAGAGQATVSFTATAQPSELEYKVTLAGQESSKGSGVTFGSLSGGVTYTATVQACLKVLPVGAPDRCSKVVSDTVEVKTRPTATIRAAVEPDPDNPGWYTVTVIPNVVDLGGWPDLDYRYQLDGGAWWSSSAASPLVERSSGSVLVEIWPIAKGQGGWSTSLTSPYSK